jgi:peroxiredoxin
MHVRSPLAFVRVGVASLLVVVAGVSKLTAPAAAIGPTQPVGAGDPVTEVEITRAFAELDAKLAGEKEPRWAAAARLPLWDFARQWQTRRLTPAQETRILSRLTAIGRAHTGGAEAVRGAQFMIKSLSVGRVAPEIAGTDLDGQSFRLSDYRGRVVALIFSGNWCGICRSDYPFTRQLLERFGAAPVVVLGVDSSTSLDAAKRVKSDNSLSYRSWWDGHAEKYNQGPIAHTWNVVGWPTVYVIDEKGVIRFVDVRKDSLIEAVGQLVVPENDK